MSIKNEYDIITDLFERVIAVFTSALLQLCSNCWETFVGFYFKFTDNPVLVLLLIILTLTCVVLFLKFVKPGLIKS
mgnify:CR=1 FL=1